ncbi:hypothetical protein [Tessaracoccus sp. OH4464_COT-324]|uniref:hypothetical protein n=1 Tax=Tessaracoccus sp. OH4464_COT-324 TaxID=2491059 RepID=UPI000F6365AA|nr:hypothetical protein [Tessaracoccus sp. OH4464_COT-324]RRD45616.1 hypothetical protein EII42_10980 [Tessaracoccus sp. OH4464_COT-324]
MKEKNYRWGRSRVKGIPTMWIAVPAGVLIALVVGVLQVVLGNPDGPLKWLGGIILGCFLAPTAAAGVGALIVDRSTLPGAVAKPEESVENTWYNKAAVVSFHATMVVCGVGAFVTTWLGLQTISLTLAGVLLMLGVSFGFSYLIIRGRS